MWESSWKAVKQKKKDKKNTRRTTKDSVVVRFAPRVPGRSSDTVTAGRQDNNKIRK